MEIRSSGVGDVLYGCVLCGMLGSRRIGPGGSNEEIAGGGEEGKEAAMANLSHAGQPSQRAAQ